MKTEQPSIFGPRTANPSGDLTEGMPDELAQLCRSLARFGRGEMTAEQLAALLLPPKQILDTLEAVQDPDETLRRLDDLLEGEP